MADGKYEASYDTRRAVHEVTCGECEKMLRLAENRIAELENKTKHLEELLAQYAGE